MCWPRSAHAAVLWPELHGRGLVTGSLVYFQLGYDRRCESGAG